MEMVNVTIDGHKKYTNYTVLEAAQQEYNILRVLP